MELAINIIVLIGALYYLLMSFITNTKNVRSAIIFKFIPFLIGISLLFTSGKMWGII